MPFGNEGVEDGIGLALSGGGFRATLLTSGDTDYSMLSVDGVAYTKAAAQALGRPIVFS
jgi:hypothetical protein